MCVCERERERERDEMRVCLYVVGSAVSAYEMGRDK